MIVDLLLSFKVFVKLCGWVKCPDCFICGLVKNGVGDICGTSQRRSFLIKIVCTYVDCVAANEVVVLFAGGCKSSFVVVVDERSLSRLIVIVGGDSERLRASLKGKIVVLDIGQRVIQSFLARATQTIGRTDVLEGFELLYVLLREGLR